MAEYLEREAAIKAIYENEFAWRKRNEMEAKEE